MASTVTTLPLQPLQQSPAPLRDAIVSALRGAIEVGELKPGARLVERELCERLSVSRTSLREALRELVSDGVIAQSRERGLMVAHVTADEARSVYSLRGAIQALVVSEFIERADEPARRAFAQAAAALQAAYGAGDVATILTAKRAFYARLCEGARNLVAQPVIERLCLRVSGLRSRAPGRAARNQVSQVEIGRIAAAVAARDVDGARTAMLDHLASVARWTLSTLPPDPTAPAKSPPAPASLPAAADLAV